jgi:hypothetical protein
MMRNTTRALALALIAGCASPADSGERPGGDPDAARFIDLNGVMWFYTTASGLRYDELAASLDDWRARGIRAVGIYSPYRGDPEMWLGAAPGDFYDVPAQNGSVDDFRELIDAAHSRDMKVIAFMGFHSIDERSDFFRTAEAQYRDGDRASPEVSAFHWTDDPSIPTPTPAPMGPSAWKMSATAGAYYWALWDNAGLDVNLPGAAAEIRRAVEFWMEIGLDGIMLDSGVVHDDFRELWIDLPRSRSDDLWLTFESTGAWDAEDYDAMGLTAWFAFEDNDYANTYSRVVFPEAGEPAIDADGLETELAAVDWARERGKLTHAWSILEREYAVDRMRVQEAALLAGAGILYGPTAHDWGYATWPADVRDDWDRVMTTVDANPALRPSASRERVNAGTDPLVYAMRRTAAGTAQTALLIYNFNPAAAEVTVELTGTGIGPQTPRDLYAGGGAPPIEGDTYTNELGGYGFAMLEVLLAGGP